MANDKKGNMLNGGPNLNSGSPEPHLNALSVIPTYNLLN
jgi:hypothetical protein